MAWKELSVGHHDHVAASTTPEIRTVCPTHDRIDEGDERVNDLVAAIASHAKTKPSIRHMPLPEARKKIGPFADALVLDQIVRSPRARALGWSPSLHSVAGNAARLFEEWRRGTEPA